MNSLASGQQSDKDLVSAYRATGDQQLLAVVFGRYSHLLFGTCMKYLKDEDAAADAVSEIYILLVQKLLEHEVTHFKSWIYTTTTNHCLMLLRKAKKNPEVELEERKYYAEVMEKPGFGHLNDELEVTEDELHKAVASLSEGQQLCVQLFFLDGKSYREISAQTGFDEKQVKSHIQNGKRNLRLVLEKKLDR
jgi:RNA polymerase sigma-70 factor (ECF subfamily)